MKIVFSKIKIRNFKGILEKKLDFSTGKNILQGENGVGKTTVLDAITWCLFGKNFADEKLFKIKPIINGEEKQNLTTSVELIVNDITIERIWENDKTTIKVDGTRFGNREFSDYLREKLMITDEEFKALSNIEYIPKLHWKDLRSLIMGLVGEITNEEVFEKHNFELIKDKIVSVGVEKTSDAITESKRNVNEKIKKILGNIDQKTKDIKELVVDEKEQNELVSRKEVIRSKIENYNSLHQQKSDYEKLVQSLEIELDNKKRLELEKNRLKESKIQQEKAYQNASIDVEIARKNDIKKLDNKIYLIKQDIELLEQEKTTLIVRRSELKQKYDSEKAREVHIENNRCSTCGQLLPKEKIEEALQKLKNESIEIANQYARQAKEMKNRVEEIELEINKRNEEIQEIEKEIESTKVRVYDSYESDIQKNIKTLIQGIEFDIKKCDMQIDDCEQNIDSKKLEIEANKEKATIVIPDNIETLQNELESITQKLAISDTLNIFRKQLEDLEKEHNSLLVEKETLLDKEQQLILFNNTRASMLKEKVKHNFKLADFITQEVTKDGKLVETFKIAIDGIEYSALNTGHKILVALDLIDNIQRMKDKRLPILIDGLGELTRLPDLNTQIIGCRAKFQVQKEMELVNV